MAVPVEAVPTRERQLCRAAFRVVASLEANVLVGVEQRLQVGALGKRYEKGVGRDRSTRHFACRRRSERRIARTVASAGITRQSSAAARRGTAGARRSAAVGARAAARLAARTAEQDENERGADAASPAPLSRCVRDRAHSERF